jgi:hypothetical protein
MSYTKKTQPQGRLLKVFTLEEQMTAANSPHEILSIERKKKDKPNKGDVVYLDHSINMTAPKQDPWFTIRDVPIRSPPDHADASNKQNKVNTAVKGQLGTTLKGLGKSGPLFKKISREYVAKQQKMIDDGLVFTENPKVLSHFMSEKRVPISQENPTGKRLYEDELFSLSVEWDKFHPSTFFEHLKDKPKCTFHDYRKPYVDDKGKTQYALATVLGDDGKEQQLNWQNWHLFITRGSIIRIGRVYIKSPTVSKMGQSMPFCLNYAVIEPGGIVGFDDGSEEGDIVIVGSSDATGSENPGTSFNCAPINMDVELQSILANAKPIPEPLVDATGMSLNAEEIDALNKALDL